MKKIDFIFSLLMITFLGIFGLLFLNSKNLEYSEKEGKILSSKPNITVLTFSKNKMEALEKYYQDHFLFRNDFLEKNISYKQKLGISINNGVYIGKNRYLLESPTEMTHSNDFIKALNTFYQNHNDIHMSLILLPTNVTVTPSLAPSNAPIYDEYHQIKSIYHQITFDTIDVVEALREGSEDYEMFYHLDSHLTSYGAYNVYREYGRFNELNISMIDFDIEEVNNEFSGDLVKSAHTFSYPKDKIVRFIPKKGLRLEVNYQDKISDTIYHEENKANVEDYFLGSKESMITITNHEAENKEILIVKDNGANMIVPFFVNDYFKVHVIDANKYEGTISEYLSLHPEIKDIVFIMKMNGLDNQIDNSLM